MPEEEIEVMVLACNSKGRGSAMPENCYSDRAADAKHESEG